MQQVHEINLQPNNISFHPASEREEVLQNVRTILTTAKFSVPLDRNFGLRFSALDSPDNITQAKLTAEIVETVPKYEPRAKVKEVLYSGNGPEGAVVARVRVVIV